MRRYHLDWTVGHTSDPSSAPERFVPASVPGAVQLDWARAEGWPHYWQDAALERYEWMEDMYWVYQTTLSFPEMESGQRLFLVCGGVDYRFLVRVGERILHGQEGMFTPVELDLTEIAEDGDLLEVVVFPIPGSEIEPRGRTQARKSVKPVVSYGWDFHPRLVPSGIWKEAFLEVRSRRHIRQLDFDYTLEEDFSVARLSLSVELNASCVGTLEWSLIDPSGEVVDGQSVALAEQDVVDGFCEVHDPELWWPRGYGEASLYSLVVSLHESDGSTLDSRQQKIGFRSCRLVMNDGASRDALRAPRSRNVPPMALEVNGRRIFVKGSNWVGPDIFPGVAGEDAYRPLLEKVVGAHLNLLRCWGGAAVSKPSFFDLCDQLGILIWQDFPLACNKYDDSPEYLDTLNQESISIIKALKPHPCLAIWCGGNELYNEWSGMTDQHKALRLLNRNCFERDPDTPFLPTSPVMGVGHGGYLFRGKDGRECFEVMQQARCSAYIEFGVPGPASVDRLRSLIPEDELFPPRPNGGWLRRHGFCARDGEEESWLCPSVVESYFGHPESIEELVGWGQLLQSSGYKAMFEEARRQKPYCSMAINWCLNEPWPAAANSSIIAWPCDPKPSYKAVRQSCRPTLASARVRKFAWRAGETFEAELWMLNDAPHAIKGDRVEACLRFDDDESFALGWYFDSIEADENLLGPVLRFKIPEIQSQTFLLILKVEGRPDWSSEYDFCFIPSE